MALIILGLGSNLGEREENLRLAIAAVSDQLLDNIRESSVISTKAITPDGAPESWDIDYLNMAIAGEPKKTMTPNEFLSEIKAIENKLGRKPSDRWAPRVIDIDILAWGKEVVTEDQLQIPHALLHKREFAYKPLLELEPDWTHPRFNKRLTAIAEPN